MKNCIVIKSSTLLYRAKKLLENRNIYPDVKKLGSSFHGGCIHCLSVDNTNIKSALAVLDNYGIIPDGVISGD